MKYEVGKIYIFNYKPSPVSSHNQYKLGQSVVLSGDQNGLIEVVGGVGNAYCYAGKIVSLKEERNYKRQEWDYDLTDRERGLVDNSIEYVKNNPSGFPGHQLITLIAKLATKLDDMF